MCIHLQKKVEALLTWNNVHTWFAVIAQHMGTCPSGEMKSPLLKARTHMGSMPHFPTSPMWGLEKIGENQWSSSPHHFFASEWRCHIFWFGDGGSNASLFFDHCASKWCSHYDSYGHSHPLHTQHRCMRQVADSATCLHNSIKGKSVEPLRYFKIRLTAVQWISQNSLAHCATTETAWAMSGREWVARYIRISQSTSFGRGRHRCMWGSLGVGVLESILGQKSLCELLLLNKKCLEKQITCNV